MKNKTKLLMSILIISFLMVGFVSGMNINVPSYDDCDKVPRDIDKTYICKMYDITPLIATAPIDQGYQGPIDLSGFITQEPIPTIEIIDAPSDWMIIEGMDATEFTIVPESELPIIEPTPSITIVPYPYKCIEKCWDKYWKCRKNHDYFKCRERREKCNDKCWAKQ